MKKKFLCMMLAGVMALSLTACGKSGEEENNPTATATPSTEAQPTTEPTKEPVQDSTPTPVPTQAPVAVDFNLDEMMGYILDRVEAPAMMGGSEYELTEIYHIDASKVEEFSIRIPMMNVTATELAAFKAVSEDAVQAIVDGINGRIDTLIAQWSSYLPDQLVLVENNKVLIQGNYIFFIIGNEELSAFAENTFLRKFDPSIEEMVIARKFHDVDGKITALTEETITVEMTEGDAVYTFECTFDEYFYAEGGVDSYAVGDMVHINFSDPIEEASGTMQGVVTYLSAAE